MKVVDFKSAALRHLKTCQVLLDHLEKKDAHQGVYASFYYLSGYVLECIFKGAILVLSKVDREKTIDGAILEKKKLKIHNLSALKRRLNRLVSGNNRIPCMNSCCLGPKGFFDGWRVDLRYEPLPAFLMSDTALADCQAWLKEIGDACTQIQKHVKL